MIFWLGFGLGILAAVAAIVVLVGVMWLRDLP